MKNYTVLCNVFSWGKVYGKKGEVVTIPESIGESMCKGPNAQLKPASEKK
jgi:hypothetical protein